MGQCSLDKIEANIFLVTLVFWVFVTAIWVTNNQIFNRNHAKSIHHYFSFVLFFRCSLSLFSFLITACPDSELSLYFLIGIGSSISLYNTFFYTGIILLSTGFCFTRDHFERNEINKMACIMGSVYISFSIYLINRNYFFLLIVCILLLILFLIRKNLNNLLLNLNRRIEVMNNNNLFASVQATRNKEKIFKKFRILSYLYFSSEILTTFVGIFFEVFEYNENYVIVLIVYQEILEILVLFGVLILFYAKYRGLYFDLPEFNAENESREVIPMYEANMQSENDNSKTYESPFIIKQPCEYESTSKSVYSNFMIALPMRVVYRRVYEGNREPLLNQDLNK